MPELSTGLIKVFVKIAKSAKVNENLSGNLRSLEKCNFLKRGQAATCDFLAAITQKNVVEGEGNSFLHFFSLDLSWIVGMQ